VYNSTNSLQGKELKDLAMQQHIVYLQDGGVYYRRQNDFAVTPCIRPRSATAIPWPEINVYLASSVNSFLLFFLSRLRGACLLMTSSRVHRYR